MPNCKICRTPIIEGEYCSRCESRRNRRIGNVVKGVGCFVGTFGLIVLVNAIKGNSDKKNNKNKT